MDNANELRHLICSEGGATAFLATTLDRDIAPGGAWHQRFRKTFADACTVTLSDNGPRYLALEKYGFDLFALWDHWAVIVEAKITSASVRQGQLGELYERGRDLLKRGQFPETSRILMVFVTPAGVGHGEFASLTVRDNDVKAYVTWETIIAGQAGPLRTEVEAVGSFLPELVMRGGGRLLGLIEDKKRGVVEWTSERRRCQEFARAVQKAVEREWFASALHFNPQWADRSLDEIYANFGGARAGNVYFQVDGNSDIAPDLHQQSILRGRLRFRVANKARREKRVAFRMFDETVIFDMLGVSEQDRRSLIRDNNALEFTWGIEWSGRRDHLTERAAEAFSCFLRASRPLMIEETG